MKKIILSIISALLCVAMICSMAACDNSSNKETEQSDTESESETKATKATNKKTETEAEKGLSFYTELPLEQLEAGVTTTSAALAKRTYKLSESGSKLRMIGRSKVINKGVICDHSASGIEFQGFMTGDLNLVATSEGDNYYTVYIDGKRMPERLHLTKANVKVTTFEGNYFHTVKILKQSESAWSQSTLAKIELTGELFDPPKERELLIEVLGDSLTTGYGNLGVKGEGNAQGGNTPLKEDATQSYGFLAAEKLNADCSIVAWSGVGLDVSYTGTSYGDYYKKYSFHRDRNGDDYDYGRAPDLLVIHLGANDSTNKQTTKEGFTNKAKELIITIREGYKKEMPIIWAYDPDEGVPEYIQEVLDSFGGEEKGLYILELEWHSKDDFWGASGHPSVKAHEAHANILVDFITTKNIIK